MPIQKVKISLIERDENISRGGSDKPKRIKELAESIVVNDIWQPPDVVKRGDKFGLKAGNRRLSAAQLLISQKRLPDVVGKGDEIYVMVHENLNDAKGAALNGLENFARENPSTYDLAYYLVHMQDSYGYTALELSKSLTKSDRYVANLLRTFRELNPIIKDSWRNNEDSDNAIPLTKLFAWASKDNDVQLDLFRSTKQGRMYFDHQESQDIVDDPKTMRRRPEVERALTNSSNPVIIHVLSWVLKQEETLNDGYTGNINIGAARANGSSGGKRAKSQSGRSVTGETIKTSTSSRASRSSERGSDSSNKGVNARKLA